MSNVIEKLLEPNCEYLYEMLKSIKQRPGMYLGMRSIVRLRAFLDGYMGARQDLGVTLTAQEKEFGKFQHWIQNRFKVTSSHGWDSIILFHSMDERDALDKFFDLFEKFISSEASEYINDYLPQTMPNESKLGAHIEGEKISIG